jgi:nicotinamide phosphoribosyltransferase
MSFATKLSYIIYEDGTERDVMKYPLTDNGKYSLPGILKVEKNESGVPIVYIGKMEDIGKENNMLKLVYDNGPVKGVFGETFDELREKVNKEWSSLPKKVDVISDELKEKCQVILKKHKEYMKELKNKE